MAWFRAVTAEASIPYLVFGFLRPIAEANYVASFLPSGCLLRRTIGGAWGTTRGIG
jgi:hypothetical protein